MEKYRIVYYDRDGEPSEAIVDAASADEAIASIEDLGRVATAGVHSLGPADAQPEAQHEGNDTSASYPWKSREERLGD